jgi:hypothetical protein
MSQNRSHDKTSELGNDSAISSISTKQKFDKAPLTPASVSCFDSFDEAALRRRGLLVWAVKGLGTLCSASQLVFPQSDGTLVA